MNNYSVIKQAIASLLIFSAFLLTLVYVYANKDKIQIAIFQYEQLIFTQSLPNRILIFDDEDTLIYQGKTSNYCINDAVQHKCVLFLDGNLDILPTTYRLQIDSDFVDSYSKILLHSIVISYDRYHLIFPKSDIENSIVEIANLLRSEGEINPNISETIVESTSAILIPAAGELPYREALISFPDRITSSNEVYKIIVEYECSSNDGASIILSDNLITTESIVINQHMPCDGRMSQSLRALVPEKKQINSLYIRNSSKESDITLMHIELLTLINGYQL